MNVNNIIAEIEKADADVYERLNTRRSTLRSFALNGGKIALSALPFAFGAMFKKAYAGTTGTADVLGVLNYALTLEYLEAEFYAKALAAPGLLPNGNVRNAIMTISKHETAHVDFLKTAITQSGGTPVDKPVFDFSGGNGSGEGPFKTVFSDMGLFLAVSQVFEDTGVRAYKGRAAELVGTGAVLTAALQIHSVEARHASYIRKTRKEMGATGDLKPWITGKQSGIDSPLVQPSYDGEENTIQAGVEIVNINGQQISTNAATESFDEGLTADQVLAIVDGFIA